ncbi:MAG: SRPBCC family protein [Acidimicrobiales bacterium]|nr:SRPBCC family protein [Acidimicrobiales bacterium]
MTRHDGHTRDLSDDPDVITVERVIVAPPEAIFRYLANANLHHEIDGSGTVVAARDAPDPLVLGSTFGMSMKMGVPYSMVSTVVEYEPNRRIAWQTKGPGRIGGRFGGRIWRYELEPVGGGTAVRESWDIRQESPLTKPLVKALASKETARNMAATLERIEALVTEDDD